MLVSIFSPCIIFQSTPSARRATHIVAAQAVATSGFQSTPSARRATKAGIKLYGTFKISIHALREEGDGLCLRWLQCCKDFNPRPPRGGRRVIDGNNAVSYEISIHALREEGDRQTAGLLDRGFLFQSTPSARRATAKAAKKSTTFVPLYTLVHNLKRNFTKAPAK